MKILSVAVLVLLLSASFCTGPDRDRSPKLKIVSIEGGTAKFVATKAEVISGDTLMFTAKKIKKSGIIIIPMADSICQLDTGDNVVMIDSITFLFIPLVKVDAEGKLKEWTSRKFIIKKHSKKTIYEYSAYIHKNKKMAEEKSSPKIIVDP